MAEMAEHAALTELPTNIKAHVRGGHAVKGYEANRLQGGEAPSSGGDIGSVERLGTDKFQSEFDKVSNSVHDKNGELRDDVPTEVVEGHAKRLFSLTGESGVDPLIHSDPNFLQSTYSTWNQHASGIDMATAHPRDALGQLLDRDNMDTIIRSVDALQTKFTNDFGIKAERIDPFTFKFNHEENIGFDNPELQNAAQRFISKKMEKFKEAFPDALERQQDPVNMGMVLDHIGDAVLDKKTFVKDVGASILLTGINNTKGILPPEALKGINEHLSNYKIPRLNFASQNPDMIRDMMTKGLMKNSPEFEGRDSIANFFKSLDIGSVTPAFHYMQQKGALPTFLLDNPAIMPEIRKMVGGISQIYQVSKPTQTEIHVSRNPMNILTMSPDGYAGSCQSLVQDGKPHVNQENINVPASYNAQATNDFLMYTRDGESGQKDARISMSYDPKSKQYVNYEGNSIYGRNLQNKAVLSEFVENNPDKFGIKSPKSFNEKDIEYGLKIFDTVDKLGSALGNHEMDFEDNMEQEDHAAAMKNYKEFGQSQNLWKDNKQNIVDAYHNEMSDFFVDSLEKEKSMLYSSRTHSLVGGSSYVTQKFARSMKNLDQFYKGVGSDMQRKLLATGKFQKKSA